MVFVMTIYKIISNNPLPFPNIEVNMIEYVQKKIFIFKSF